MNLRTFLFDASGRLRSGWRVAIFLACFAFAVAVAGALIAVTLAAAGYTSMVGSPFFLAVSGGVSLVIALTIGWLCGKYLEGLPFRALGAWFTYGWLRNLIVGLVLGLLTLAAAAGIAAAFGGVWFLQNKTDGAGSIAASMAVSLGVFAVAAAFEESLFRGYILQTFARSGLIWFGVLLTAVLFASVHQGNPGVNKLAWINTFLAGIWFGIAYLRTRDLWFVTGLHLMWNWAQGSLFGIEVSGLKEIAAAPLLREVEYGPAWLTGGDYGLEGGLACTAALALSMLAIHFLPFVSADRELLAMTSPRIQESISEV
jgi:membrane protease YdiL (CAAX protease family)